MYQSLDQDTATLRRRELEKAIAEMRRIAARNGIALSERPRQVASTTAPTTETTAVETSVTVPVAAEVPTATEKHVSPVESHAVAPEATTTTPEIESVATVVATPSAPVAEPVEAESIDYTKIWARATERQIRLTTAVPVSSSSQTTTTPLPASEGIEHATHPVGEAVEKQKLATLSFAHGVLSLGLPRRDTVIRFRPLGIVTLVGLFVTFVWLIQPNANAFFNRFYKHIVTTYMSGGEVFGDTINTEWEVKQTANQQIDLHASSQMITPFKGAYAIRFRPTKANDALRLQALPDRGIALSAKSQLRVSLNGGLMGSQHLHVQTEIDGQPGKTMTFGPLQSERWQTFRVPLASAGKEPGRLTGISLYSDAAEPVLYIDDITVE